MNWNDERELLLRKYIKQNVVKSKMKSSKT